MHLIDVACLPIFHRTHDLREQSLAADDPPLRVALNRGPYRDLKREADAYVASDWFHRFDE